MHQFINDYYLNCTKNQISILKTVETIDFPKMFSIEIVCQQSQILKNSYTQNRCFLQNIVNSPCLYIFFSFSYIFVGVFVYMEYLCRPSEASTRYWVIPGGYPPQDWQSLPCAGEELDSNPGLLIKYWLNYSLRLCDQCKTQAKIHEYNPNFVLITSTQNSLTKVYIITYKN